MLTNQFHKLYYDASETWTDLKWLGVQAQKFPGDLWVYQEIITEQRPDWIIESGTNRGGSALFLASVCEALGHGRVILDRRPSPIIASTASPPRVHRRLVHLGRGPRSIAGSRWRRRRSHGPARLRSQLRARCSGKLDLYSDLVTPGSYLVVEDTNLAGHPVKSYLRAGPYEAVREFLATNSLVPPSIDRARNSF